MSHCSSGSYSLLEMSGKSEKNIVRLFDNAKRLSPSLLFFDEIDCITSKRDGAGKEIERRIVAQFLSCMDDLGNTSGNGNVIVVGATNRPEALDPSLRRAGRFDREINLGVPDEAGVLFSQVFNTMNPLFLFSARLHILKVVCSQLRTEGSFDLQVQALHYTHSPPPAAFPHPPPAAQAIAHLTPGFVGADLEAISKEASTIAVKRIINRNSLSGSQVGVSLKYGCCRRLFSFARISAGDYAEQCSFPSSFRRCVNELYRYIFT